MTRNPEKLQEPQVEVRQPPFAELLRDLDKNEEREEDAEHGHEHGGFLLGEPSRAGNDDATRDLHGLMQMPAAPAAARVLIGLKVSHRYGCARGLEGPGVLSPRGAQVDRL